MQRPVRRSTSILTALGIGAGAMYFLDPNRGARRRGLVRDKAARLGRTTGALGGKAWRDARNQTLGAGAALRSRLRRDSSATDEIVAERVRSAIGHVATNPGALEVQVEDRTATLSGPILESDADRVRRATRRTRGVRRLDDRMEVHEQAADVPALQAGPEARLTRTRTGWRPVTRIAAAAAGTGLLAWAAVRRDALSAALAAVGAGVLARGTGNRPLRQLVGRAKRPVIDVQKTIHIAAPVEPVYALLADPTSLPRFMEHLKNVTRIGDELYRWEAKGPLGMDIGWDAAVTRRDTNERIEWRSEPGSDILTEGAIHLAEENGGTRVHVQLAYTPPAGAIGHAVASLLGDDPKSAMDADLLRLKSLLEHGVTRVDGERVSREDVARVN